MRNRLEYAAVMCVSMLARRLPRPASLALGGMLGRLFYIAHGRRRQLALDNLATAFPSRSERECKEVLRGTFSHVARHAIELFNFDVMSASEIMGLVDLEGDEHVEQAIDKGKGVLFLTGHFGYWELLGMHHSLRFKPLSVVARPLKNPLLERQLERIRTRVGSRVITRQGAIRGMLRVLLDGGSIGVLIDQHSLDRSAVVVDYFNRPAATTSAIAALALRTGAPVVPAFALPAPGGRYRMVYETPVLPPADDDPNPVLTYTQRCTDVLEMYVRRYPELWLWMHRRWRVPESDVVTGTTATVSTQGAAREDVR